MTFRSALLGDLRLEKLQSHHEGRRLVSSPGCGIKLAKPVIDNGLLAGDRLITRLIVTLAMPPYGARAETDWYSVRGFLRLGQDFRRYASERTAHAVCAARGYVGLDGKRICMPPGWHLHRGVLVHDELNELWFMRGKCTARSSHSKKSFEEILAFPGWEPIDDTPPEICRIDDPLAYEAALRSYRACM